VADIGGGDGIISKMIAKGLNASRIDMYDPFVSENRKVVLEGNVTTNFYRFDFNYP